MLPSRRNTITSSISLQSATYSSFLSPVPTKPSSRFTYSLVFRRTTFVASILSKFRISVLRSRPLPYLSLRFWKYFTAKSIMCSKLYLTCSISPSKASSFSWALSISNLEIRLIRISVSLTISSSVTSRRRCFVKGFNPSSIAFITPSQVSSSSIRR